MPRNTNPGSIRVGSGKDERDRLILKVGNDPFPGLTVAHMPPDTTSPGDARYGIPQPSQEGGGGGLWAHVRDGHPAEDITLEGADPLVSHTVKDALVELAGDLPPEPSTIGMWRVQDTVNCIPDWGRLKLADSSLVARELLTTDNDPAAIFPYYWVPPSPAIPPLGATTEFSPNPGADPQTDPLWNSGIPQAGLPGAGPGTTFAGAFTRPFDVPNSPVIRTDRIFSAFGSIYDPRTEWLVQTVTISGVVYPADRGVLALIHLPPGMTDWTDFTTRPLTQRCPAALLLGQGIWGASENGACDGEPGGIFAEGDTPFAFPGRATGQYNLTEIVTGQTDIEGIVLTPPFDDLDHDGVQGAKRFINTPVPGPGQVRLGTDPDAAPLIDLTDYVYGIPVLGADHRYYSPDLAPAPPAGMWDFGYPWNYPITYAVESNFFQYRLPCLDDYSQATGLIYTPAGPTYNTREKNRYFIAALPTAATAPYLDQAGNYPDFPEVDWARQIARFRHTILLPQAFEIGTFWLIHFKTEADFEKFMLDPVSATAAYEVYGATSIGQAEVTASEVVNTETDPTVPPPAGPAPNYGYKSKWYHDVRAEGLQDLLGSHLFVPDVNECVWSVARSPGVMRVSGVAYFTVIDPVTGAGQFQFDSLNMTVPSFWGLGYRTADVPLDWDGLNLTAPAQIASMNPAFLGLAAFAWGEGLDQALFTDRPYALPVGATDGDIYLHTQRAEFPYTHLGGYSETNGPLLTDPLTLSINDPITFRGDPLDPAFTTDAQVRLFLRVPLGHEAVDTSTLPFDADLGHGNVVTLVPASGASGKLLVHTSRYNATNFEGQFGNYVGGGGWVPDTLYTDEKDSYERFLDEVYRWEVSFAGVPYPDKKAALLGPGLPWAGGFFSVPIRIGASASVPWSFNSWVCNARHVTFLPTHELQVAGLPDRNPPLSAAGLYPFPSVGLLMYPQKDYTTGYRPNNADDTVTQPDYSALPATDALRQYVRAFDAGFGPKWLYASGSPFVTIRLDGVRLSHFAYTAPGPGRLLDYGFSVEFKVPGLTTWMDLGRPDGSGPSKQDIAQDGAGCMVIGPETFEDIDPATGFWYSQVKVHLGPTACLTAVRSDRTTCPVLVRVSMRGGDTALKGGLPFNLEVTSSNDAATPGTPGSNLRGLIGIRIVDTYPALPPPPVVT